MQLLALSMVVFHLDMIQRIIVHTLRVSATHCGSIARQLLHHGTPYLTRTCRPSTACAEKTSTCYSVPAAPVISKESHHVIISVYDGVHKFLISPCTSYALAYLIVSSII
jgi:hypothetical protein